MTFEGQGRDDDTLEALIRLAAAHRLADPERRPLLLHKVAAAVVDDLPRYRRQGDQLRSDVHTLYRLSISRDRPRPLAAWMRSAADLLSTEPGAEDLRLAADTLDRLPTEGADAIDRVRATVDRPAVGPSAGVTGGVWLTRKGCVVTAGVAISLAALVIASLAIFWQGRDPDQLGAWLDAQHFRSGDESTERALSSGTPDQRRLAALMLGITDGLVEVAPELWRPVAVRYQVALLRQDHVGPLDRANDILRARVVRDGPSAAGAWFDAGVAVGRWVAGEGGSAVDLPPDAPGCLQPWSCGAGPSCRDAMFLADACFATTFEAP